jgi:hypothetical protein
VIDLDPTLGQDLLQVPVGQPEPQLPAHRQQDHLSREPVAGQRRPRELDRTAGSATLHPHSLAEKGAIDQRNRAAAGYRFEPSPLLNLAWVCLDEFDKPAGEKQRAALKILQARTWVSRGGQKIRISPAVTVLMNRSPDTVFKPEFLRRSLCFNTGAVAQETQEMGLDRLQSSLEDTRRVILGVGAFQRLDLDGLEDPGSLPEPIYRLMREAVWGVSTTGAGNYWMSKRWRSWPGGA